MNATEAAERYVESWNETDEQRRQGLIERLFAADVTYVDPIMAGAGHAGLSQLIAGVQARFPGWRLRSSGTADSVGDYVRFSWELGPANETAPIAGTDFVLIEDGRIASVTGFFDRVPAEVA